MKKSTRRNASVLAEPMRLAYMVNEETDSHVFIYFHGHVGTVDLDIHTNGWKTGESADNKWSAYITERKRVRAMCNELKRILQFERILSKTL